MRPLGVAEASSQGPDWPYDLGIRQTLTSMRVASSIENYLKSQRILSKTDKMAFLLLIQALITNRKFVF